MRKATICLLLVVLFVAVVKCEEDPEKVYGKLLVVPPKGAMNDDPSVGMSPDDVEEGTWNDYMKAKNSKFLGIARSSEDSAE